MFFWNFSKEACKASSSSNATPFPLTALAGRFSTAMRWLAASRARFSTTSTALAGRFNSPAMLALAGRLITSALLDTACRFAVQVSTFLALLSRLRG